MAAINKINVNGTEYDIKPFEGNEYNMDPAGWSPKRVGKVLTPGGDTKDLYMKQIMGVGEVSENSTILEVKQWGSMNHSLNPNKRVYKIEGVFSSDYGATGKRYVTSINGIGVDQESSITLFISNSNFRDFAGQTNKLTGVFYATIYYYEEL